MTLSDCQAESWPLLDCACMDHGSPGSPSDERLEVEGMAKLILYNLTGSKYGVCEVEIRPCTDTRVCCSYCGLGVGAFGQCCQCRVCGEITLPGPIHRVLDVMVDGELVPRETYRVDDRYWLVNLTGSWPRCQDLRAAFDDGDAFTVWYEQGTPPPKGAGLAVGKLACELWKAFCGDDSCAIPGLATRITRQGITVELLDLFTMGTGIPAVDMWITSLEKTARTGRVYSPDTARGDRRTTQPPGSTSP